MQRDDQDIDTNNHSKYWEQSRQHLGVGDRGGTGDKKSSNISLSSVIQKCLTGNYLWFIVTLSRGRVLVMYRYPNLICPHSTIAWHYQFEPKLCFFYPPLSWYLPPVGAGGEEECLFVARPAGCSCSLARRTTWWRKWKMINMRDSYGQIATPIYQRLYRIELCQRWETDIPQKWFEVNKLLQKILLSPTCFFVRVDRPQYTT